MFCPHCGAQVVDGGSFCPACGGQVTAPAAAAPPTDTPPAPPPPSEAPAYPPPSPPPPAQPAVPQTASPAASYAKAPLGARVLALIVDGIIASALLPVGIMLVIASATRDEPSIPGLALIVVGGLWQLGYTLGRDAFGGAGAGKRLTGLVVLSSKTGHIAGAGPAVTRQVVLYALQLIPVVGTFIEPVMVLIDKDGKRVGDKAAKTQVVSRAAAQATGVAAPAGKGAAIGMLSGALLATLIGGAIGGFVMVRALSGAEPSFASTPSVIEEPAQEMPAEQPAPAPAPETSAESEPAADAPVANPLSAETAVDAVGNLLNYLKENNVDAARAHATRNFQEEKDWFFMPAGGALASFEVTDVYQDQALWVVEVTEDWNSGPQKARYFVIVEDNTVRVDDVDHLDQ